MKEYTRSNCHRQSHRLSHKSHGEYRDEGWSGNCGLNEVTCNVKGYGNDGLLTFDWKHFPYEDYDNYLWGIDGIFPRHKINRTPDVVIIQTGLHTCFHAHAEVYSNRSKHVVNYHTSQLPTLMSAISQATSSYSYKEAKVIFMTSGYTQHNKSQLDQCIDKINRAVVELAHHGFIVLERGEIERRLVYKYVDNAYKASPINLGIHLSQPSQSIIATSLVHMMRCLESSQTHPHHQLRYTNESYRLTSKFLF